jgi:hypothetical protein
MGKFLRFESTDVTTEAGSAHSSRTTGRYSRNTLHTTQAISRKSQICKLLHNLDADAGEHG